MGRSSRRALFPAFCCALAASAAHAMPFESAPPGALALARSADPDRGQAPDDAGQAVAPLTPRGASDEHARAALERGLAWLAAAQAGTPDGSFPSAGGREQAPVAICALGALAYMAGGSTLESGPHGRELARAIDWLLEKTELDPSSETYGYVSAAGDTLSRTHGHGFATLALAEAYGISPRSDRGSRLHGALRAAVQRIELSQGIEGGWHYAPYKTAEHEGSVTICLVQGLRAARNAGVEVQSDVIARAVDYVSRLQNEDGSFRYSLGIDRSSVALTAASISTLNATGTYSGKVIDDGYDWIFRELLARDEPEARTKQILEGRLQYPFYERLYLAQAFWQHPRHDVFDGWARTETVRLITDQEPDGSWKDERYGASYATAMNCLVLALPEGLLPIFQR